MWELIHSSARPLLLRDGKGSRTGQLTLNFNRPEGRRKRQAKTKSSPSELPLFQPGNSAMIRKTRRKANIFEQECGEGPYIAKTVGLM
jgi:hypothetical protein